VADTEKPYNPLDRVELGKSVERALLARPLVPLPPANRFGGAGLYAIYYVGDLPPYRLIAPPARKPGEVPIYVGRARPQGARQGLAGGLEATTSAPVLFNRLKQHAQSIEKVEDHANQSGIPGLRSRHFLCRYLVADDIWVPLGEALLIGHYRPIWNVVVDGFGNHAPGIGRSRQARSSWDELHPGREWASDLPPARRSAAEISGLVEQHLRDSPVPDLDVAPVLDVAIQEALDIE
jgi:hypothetical protein